MRLREFEELQLVGLSDYSLTLACVDGTTHSCTTHQFKFINHINIFSTVAVFSKLIVDFITSTNVSRSTYFSPKPSIVNKHYYCSPLKDSPSCSKPEPSCN